MSSDQVRCPNCGSRQSRIITPCPYCGTQLEPEEKDASDIGLPAKKTGKITMTMLNYTKEVESSENLSKLYNPRVDYEWGASVVRVVSLICGPLLGLMGIGFLVGAEYILGVITLAIGAFFLLMALTKIKRE